MAGCPLGRQPGRCAALTSTFTVASVPLRMRKIVSGRADLLKLECKADRGKDVHWLSTDTHWGIVPLLHGFGGGASENGLAGKQRRVFDGTVRADAQQKRDLAFDASTARGFGVLRRRRLQQPC